MHILLSPEQKLAQRIITKHKLTPPVDVLSLIKKYANYEEENIPYDVDAICIINNERPQVILNKKNQNQARKRFTLAHELGHIVIPWHVGMFSCHTEGKHLFDDAKSQYYEMEEEANNFAAELLMPSYWMAELVNSIDEIDLGELINRITEEAEVSLTAAFFTVFNFLPSGYIGFFKNHDRSYGKRLVSRATDVVIPKQGDSIDIDWLNSVASHSGCYNTETFIIYWWKVDQVSEEKINLALKELEEYNLTHVLNSLIFEDKKHIASIYNRVISKLPLGYVIIFSGGDYERIYYSNGTNVPVPSTKRGYDREWLNTHSDLAGELQIFNYKIYWWRFPVNGPSDIRSQDKRPSRLLLKQILAESYADLDERKRVMFSINGIIGNLNNRKPKDFNEFYT
ncbi:ImmA/IrrE family metallo-endopeptidase [Paenibacillus naphthalenovorans]|uniref:ImmA/IrrE family metallo-endopeptidase n=1 Tax=Paenibacillus naphthalenovorans TaxID=162209 RepID=UPI003D29211B